MSYTLTLTDLSAAQLAAIGAVLGGGAVAEQAKPAPRKAAPAKPEPKAEEPETVEETDDDTQGEAGTDVPSEADLVAAGKDYAAANGRDAFIGKLAEFDVKNISALPEDKRAEFLAAIS